MENNCKNILLLLPPGTEIFEAAAFIDVFGWHQTIGSATCRLITCSSKREIALSFGQTMLAQICANEVIAENYAALALPGGFGSYGYYEHACSKPYLSLIKHFNDQHKPIAAVCTGAIALAQAGILKGRLATTYCYEAGFAEQIQKAGAVFINAPLQIDGHIITSQNPASAIPVALALLEKTAGCKERAYIQKQMGF
ncbi:MAG: DJ-1/PfpI family protein [Firmicutes bacterium]|nr:DJ-1/PfpI family protein [Bacillota bacterium]